MTPVFLVWFCLAPSKMVNPMCEICGSLFTAWFQENQLATDGWPVTGWLHRRVLPWGVIGRAEGLEEEGQDQGGENYQTSNHLVLANVLLFYWFVCSLSSSSFLLGGGPLGSSQCFFLRGGGGRAGRNKATERTALGMIC